MNPTAAQPTAPFDVEAVRAQFPILTERVYDKPLVYLDNAATSQKPLCVIEALDEYYRHYNANIHRGIHYLAERGTEAFETARHKLAEFVGAEHTHEIIYTRGTTESINLVAQSYARTTLKPDDEVLITHMEHHSNIVPWQIVCEQTGALLKVIPINDRGELDLSNLDDLLTERTKIVALNHISNALGTINPVKRITEAAHKVGCDFYAMSGHKMFGPTGIGILWGREQLLEHMPPYQGGGDMIHEVTFEKTVYNELPHKFEAGTPHIAGGIGLGAAVEFMNGLDYAAMEAHEHDLTTYATEQLSAVDGLNIIGTAADKVGVFSFTLDGVHPYDMAPVLDRQGIAVRTGHHCAQPVMDRFGVPATVRASIALYNTRAEIDALVAGLKKVQKMFADL